MPVSSYNDDAFGVHMHCPDIPLKLIKWWLACTLVYSSNFGTNTSLSDHFNLSIHVAHSAGTEYHD